MRSERWIGAGGKKSDDLEFRPPRGENLELELRRRSLGRCVGDYNRFGLDLE